MGRAYRQFPRRGKPFVPAAAVVVPVVSSWVHPVNQPYIKKSRQQPRYNPLPPLRTGESPKVSLWKHETNQSLKNRIRRPQQPQQYGQFWAQNKAFIAPSLMSWMQPVNQPVRGKRRQQANRAGVFTAALVVAPVVPIGWQEPITQPRIVKKRQQPVYGKPPVLRTGESPLVSLWKHETNQPLKSRIRRPQQPQSYGTFWAQNKSFVIPALESWMRPTNQPIRGKRRQQPNNVGLFTATFTAAVIPNVSQWARPTNQPYIKKKRQQPQGYGQFWSQNKSFIVPPLEGWIQPTNQPLRSRVPKRQQPQNYGQFWAQDKEFIVPSLEAWIQATNQPLKNRVPKRQQPQAYGNFWVQNKSFVIPALESWMRPTNQPVRGKRRQQPQLYGQFWAQDKEFIIPTLEGWVQPTTQPLRNRVSKRQQPQRYNNPYYDIPRIVPLNTTWIHPVNQPRIVKKRQQPLTFIQFAPVLPVALGIGTLWTNIRKGIAQWTDNDVKLKTPWVNDIIKNPSQYTPVAKTSSVWLNESVVQISYLYDDPTLTYDKSNYSYDYINPQANQSNNRNPTPWTLNP